MKQKKQECGTIYSIMFTIVGLGNHGLEYEKTRHNIGWMILMRIITEHNFSQPTMSKLYTARMSEGDLYGVPVCFFFPQTYMNHSGRAVSKYIRDHDGITSLIVVHDDVDIPFGTVRISYGRGAGGHNGVVSIIQSCGSKDFVRIRVGVAPQNALGAVARPSGDVLASYVLGVCTPTELTHIPALADRVLYAVQCIVSQGVTYAMQEVNKEIV